MRCGTCASFLARDNCLSPSSPATSPTAVPVWQCAFCARDDNVFPSPGASAIPGEAAATAPPLPELSVDTVDYVHPTPARAAAPQTVVLIVDENVDATQARWLRAAIASVHAATAQRGARFALLSVGAACAIAAHPDVARREAPVLEYVSAARARSLSARDKARFFLRAPLSAGNVAVPKWTGEDGRVEIKGLVDGRQAKGENEGDDDMAEFHALTDHLVAPHMLHAVLLDGESKLPFGSANRHISPSRKDVGGASPPRCESARARGAHNPEGGKGEGKDDFEHHGDDNDDTDSNDDRLDSDDLLLLHEERLRRARSARLPPEVETRRLDIALAVAFELLKGSVEGENARILSMITGPPSLPDNVNDGTDDETTPSSPRDASKPGKEASDSGDGAVSMTSLKMLYESIGLRAGELRVALDFLVFSAPIGFGGAVFLGAAKRSRGGLVYCAAHSFSAGGALAEAATFLADRSADAGVVSIRVSGPLEVARVIGPAFPTAAAHTYAVPGIDATAGFTVVLRAKDDIIGGHGSAEGGGNDEKSNGTSQGEFAVVQLAAKGAGSTRVVTLRVPVTRDRETFLKGLDVELAALVLGKACIVSGGGLTQPSVAARSIDATVRTLLRGPEAVRGTVRLLYELRRGTLIGSQLSGDQSLVLRSFFLRAECVLASLLLSPRLFTNAVSEEGTGLMGEVPLERAYITEGAVVVLDTGFNMFVLVGDGSSKEAEDAISASALKVAAQRVTPCQLWKLRTGRDADYVLDAYLSPLEGVQKKRRRGGVDEAVRLGFAAYCKSIAPKSALAVAEAEER